MNKFINASDSLYSKKEWKQQQQKNGTGKWECLSLNEKDEPF